jgi:hypothetical protein
LTELRTGISSVASSSAPKTHRAHIHRHDVSIIRGDQN